MTSTAKEKIGPVATHLLFENEHVKIWQMDTGAGQTYPSHYHNYDYVLFQTTDIPGGEGERKGDEEYKRVWKARSGAGGLRAHGLHYIPGTGFLSPGFSNRGKEAFTAALIEVKRPRRSDQEGIGYSRSDALVGLPPREGRVHLLENDRVRVYETTLAPGQSAELWTDLDTAVYVIEGGKIRIVEGDGSGKRRTREEDRPSIQGYWLPGGFGRQSTNIGATRYRELSVELK